MLLSYLQTAAREASRRPFRSVPAGYAHIHAHKQELSTHKRAHTHINALGTLFWWGVKSAPRERRRILEFLSALVIADQNRREKRKTGHVIIRAMGLRIQR